MKKYIILSVLILLLIIIFFYKKSEYNNVVIKESGVEKVETKKTKIIVDKRDDKINVLKSVDDMQNLLAAMSNSNPIDEILKYGNYAQLSRLALYSTNIEEMAIISKKMVEISTNELQKIQAQIFLARAYRGMSEYKKALNILFQIPDNYSSARYECKTMEKYTCIATIYQFEGNFPKAYRFMEKAVKKDAIYKKNKHFQVSLYYYMARYAGKLGDKEKQKYYLIKAINETPKGSPLQQSAKVAKETLQSLNDSQK